jgi:hypothetical protein
MPEHRYNVGDKEKPTVKDFTTKKGLVPTEQQMGFVTFVAKCACDRGKKLNGSKRTCGKKLYGSEHVPATDHLDPDKKFTYFQSLFLVTGPADAYRTVTATRRADGEKKAEIPRNWDLLWYLLFVNAHLTDYIEFPKDFQDVLKQKAEQFPECRKAYNAAKCKEQTYEDADKLFDRAQRFFDLLPQQPTPGKCKSHKRKADDKFNLNLLVKHACIAHPQPAVVPMNMHVAVLEFDNIMQAGIKIGITSVMAQATVQASTPARGIPYSAVVQHAVVPMNMQASVAVFDNILKVGVDLGVAYANALASVHVAVPRVEPPVPLLEPVVPVFKSVVRRVKPPVPLFKPVVGRLKPPVPLFKPVVRRVEPALAVMTEFKAFFDFGHE